MRDILNIVVGRARRCAGLAFLGGIPFLAHATDINNVANFRVTAQVENRCTVTAQNLNFGTVDPSVADVPLATPGKITVTCNGALGVSSVLAGLTGGQNPGAHRQMMNATSDLLPYDIYSDANFTQLWGNSHTGFDTQVALTIVNQGGSKTGSHNVYAKIFQDSALAGGTYTDIIAVNLAF